MKKLLLSITLLCAAMVSAQEAPEKLPMDPEVRYGRLDNGLTYYIRHNEQPKQRAEFHIAQAVGAILEEHAEGHHEIAQLLMEREVITSDDVERILGPRPWKSRGDELLEVNAALAESEKPKKRTRKKKTNEEDI